MSRFKKLKSLFIVEEEGKPGKKEAKPQKKEPVSKKEPTPKQPVIKTPPVKGKVDQRFTDTLLKAIESNNLEGFDYLEFKQALQNMSKIEPDEAKAFKTAFITAQTLGVTPAKLIDSARFYLDILKKEETKFNQALEGQKNKNVHQRTERIKSLESGIAKKADQMKKLENEIIKHTEELEQLKKEVQNVANKIAVTKSNFDASYDLLKKQLDQDINKINQYLK